METNPPTIEFVVNVFGKTEHVTYPDFAKLFPLTQGCAKDCGKCPKCLAAEADAMFSPRNAVLMYECTEFLNDHLRQDGDSWDALKGLLPRIARSKEPQFYARFVEIFDRFNKVLSQGEFPDPKSTAEEMALHIALDEMESRVDDAEHIEIGKNEILRFPEYDQSLPRSEDDFDTEILRMSLLQDQDILNLFEPSLDGIEDAPDPYNLNLVNLHPTKWFDPFWPE